MSASTNPLPSPPGVTPPQPSITPPMPPAPLPSTTFAPPAPQGFVGFGAEPELGYNWPALFRDAEGIPLNMLSFEQIDFGAVSYKEIFQNAKVILSTPVFSCALERLLGVDARIVDLPLNAAAEATVAMLQALYFWEPRVEVMNIDFTADVINGHLIATLQLKIRNVIYGTDTPYTVNNVFATPTVVQGALPVLTDEPVFVPVPGPPGAAGARGSLWFSGTTDPAKGALVPITSKAPTPGPPGAAGKRGFVWLSGTGDPVAPQDKDMYLNAANGDVWQFDGASGTWLRTGGKQET